jgi:hypothetical protein
MLKIKNILSLKYIILYKMRNSAKTLNNICNYCNKEYSSVSALNRHLRETKCSVKLNDVNDNKKECMWCKTSYVNIQHHYKFCKADKETVHLSALEIICLKEKENIGLKKQINDLQEKLFNLANKSTTTNTINTTTYNTILNCDKPLILDKEYITKQLIDYCGIPYLRRGGKGICDWFLESVCTNEQGNLCIECVDKNRKIFKFEDVDEKINEISGKDIVDLIKSCYPEFKKTLHYLAFLQEVEEYCKATYPEEDVPFKQYEYFCYVENIYNDFVNRLVSRTHKDSFKSLLKTINKEEVN